METSLENEARIKEVFKAAIVEALDERKDFQTLVGERYSLGDAV